MQGKLTPILSIDDYGVALESYDHEPLGGVSVAGKWVVTFEGDFLMRNGSPTARGDIQEAIRDAAGMAQSARDRAGG